MCYIATRFSIEEAPVLKRMIFGMLLTWLVVPQAAFAASSTTTEHKTVYCKRWSPDGSQVRISIAKSTSLCEYAARNMATTPLYVVDFVLKTLCSSYKCHFLTEMTVDEDKLYRDLVVAHTNLRPMVYQYCIHVTPDSDVIQIITMFKPLYKGGPCDESNLLRWYNRRTMEVCIKDGGCMPLHYQLDLETEYANLARKYPRRQTVFK